MLRLAHTIPLLLLAACGGGAIGSGVDEPPGLDASPIASTVGLDGGVPAPTSADAFFANDPPPKYCGPDGGWQPPAAPGGTPQCPDDKNLQGCPCTKKGQTAACWPGPRQNRNHGVCKDGVATCELHGEHELRWGACQGAVLPTPGVTKGPGACTCFSKGQWAIDNLSPCLVTYPDGKVYAVSTYLNSAGQPSCPVLVAGSAPPPQPEAGKSWSTSTLTVDCAGQFKLCMTIKAGDVTAPQASDCVLARACVDVWYPKAGATQKLPDLPGWSSGDPTCAKSFTTTGGYGEMSVQGTSIECETVDDNGQPRVFLRVGYCPAACSQNPSLPGCQSCAVGANGSF